MTGTASPDPQGSRSSTAPQAATDPATADATPKFRALVVDYGGVLTTPLQDAMAAFAEDLGIELQDLVRVALGIYYRSDGAERDDLVVKFETGAISDHEFARALAERLSTVAPARVDPEGLVERMFAGMKLEHQMLDVVRAAKAAGLQTGLLSNSWGLWGYPRDLLAQLFDVTVISGEVGLRKPDPAIFTLTTARLGVPAAGCIFVDDHPGHLKAALEAGMTTVLHRSPAQTIAELEALLSLPLRAAAPPLRHADDQP